MKVRQLDARDIRSRLRGEGLRLKIGPFVNSVQSSLSEVAAAVGRFYADYALAGEEEFVDFWIHLDPAPGLRGWPFRQIVFRADGVVSSNFYPRRLAVPLMEWGMSWCVGGAAHRYLLIHSAVLARDDRAVVICGASGRGKSTLCAGLALSGWRLLSDEIALVQPHDGRIRPLVRPISLKNHAIELIRNFSPRAELGPSYADTSKGTVAHLLPPAESVAASDRTAAPAWLVFVRYRAGSPTRLQRARKGTSLLRLADNAFNYNTLGARGFELSARLIEQCDCYQLEYGDLADGVRRLGELPLPEAALCVQ